LSRVRHLPARLTSFLIASGAIALAACAVESTPNALSRRGGDAPDTPERRTDDAGPGGPAPREDGGPGSAGPDGGSLLSNGPDKPRCKHTPHQKGLVRLQQAGGLSFHVYAPPRYDRNVGHAVVVLLHGQDSNGVPELNALWKPIADAEGLVLVAPKGSRAPTSSAFPDGGNWATADLDKVLDLMTDVDDCYNVFTNKHLLWGFSAGAFYGYLLGLGAAERFSGLAMGGANTSFAQQNGYRPSSAAWKIPVSHVHGVADFNPIALSRSDRDAFVAAGHVFQLREHAGGHSITPEQVQRQYEDLKASVAP